MIFKKGKEFAKQIEIENINKLDIRIKFPKNEGVKDYPGLLACKGFTEFHFNFKLKMRFSPLQIVNLIAKIEKQYKDNVFRALIINMSENSEKPAGWREVFLFCFKRRPRVFGAGSY